MATKSDPWSSIVGLYQRWLQLFQNLTALYSLCSKCVAHTTCPALPSQILYKIDTQTWIPMSECLFFQNYLDTESSRRRSELNSVLWYILRKNIFFGLNFKIPWGRLGVLPKFPFFSRPVRGCEIFRTPHPYVQSSNEQPKKVWDAFDVRLWPFLPPVNSFTFPRSFSTL